MSISEGLRETVDIMDKKHTKDMEGVYAEVVVIEEEDDLLKMIQKEQLKAEEEEDHDSDPQTLKVKPTLKWQKLQNWKKKDWISIESNVKSATS